MGYVPRHLFSLDGLGCSRRNCGTDSHAFVPSYALPCLKVSLFYLHESCSSCLLSISLSSSVSLVVPSCFFLSVSFSQSQHCLSTPYPYSLRLVLFPLDATLIDSQPLPFVSLFKFTRPCSPLSSVFLSREHLCPLDALLFLRASFAGIILLALLRPLSFFRIFGLFFPSTTLSSLPLLFSLI